MTNTLRSLLTLLVWPTIVVALVLSTGCAGVARQTATHGASAAARVAAREAFDRLSTAAMLELSRQADIDAQRECGLQAEPDSDLWWDCMLAYTTERCEAEGWCE